MEYVGTLEQIQTPDGWIDCAPVAVGIDPDSGELRTAPDRAALAAGRCYELTGEPVTVAGIIYRRDRRALGWRGLYWRHALDSAKATIHHGESEAPIVAIIAANVTACPDLPGGWICDT